MSARVRGIVFLLCVLSAPAATSAQTPDDFFNSEALQRIDLLVNSRDWEKLKANFQVNDYYPADVRWNGITVRNVGIRSRGLSTRSGTKPALRVDINRYTSGQLFLGLKSFLLDNLVSDPTGIRERLTMKMYERMGLPAPREAHVTLYVNNEYAGLYVVIESIDKDFLKRVFGETNGDTENDGYLFEFKFQDPPWVFNYMGSDLAPYASRFEPTTHEQASPETLYRPIEAMTRTVNESNDGSFMASVGAYIDLPLFMRHLAVQTFVAEVDGLLGFAGMANFYFYRFEQSTRSQFIPWDEDRSFANHDRPILLGIDDNVLARKAMAQGSLRDAFFAGLLEAANAAAEPTGDPAAPTWIEREIRQQRSRITEMMRSDPVKPFSNDDYEAAMNDLAAIARARIDFVRTEVARSR